MSNLNGKFDVLRGWDIVGDATVAPSLPPYVSGGVPVTLAPGNIVYLRSDGTVDVATTGAVTTPDDADALRLYVVVEGNDVDYSAQFVGKVVCLRGNCTVKTDKFDVADAFPVAGKVSFVAGLLTDFAATNQVIGVVLENNVTVDGTITVELTL